MFEFNKQRMLISNTLLYKETVYMQLALGM